MTQSASYKPLHHGGQLGQAARRWGIPKHQWLDLSTGINPLGWPVPAIPPAFWQRLPDEDDGLEERLRVWSSAPANARCVPIPGSQAAIQTLPYLRPPCRVGVPTPGYEEHAHCWAKAGHQVIPVPLTTLEQGDSWLSELDVLVWINPNNPTALTLPRQRLLDWHEQLVARGGWLIVDEAFAEGQPDISLADRAGMPGLIVLRSIGKFYGLAGVRAGAVLTNNEIAQALKARLGPWALSGPARYLMAEALQDQPWQAQTKRRLAADSQRLDQLLASHSLAGSTGTLLFRYVPHPEARPIADYLASKGILVRCFDDPLAVRFGLPGDGAEWQRLEQALMQMTNIVDH